ncbi:MAG: aminodeoxychorismate lyase [Acidithiobacillus ferriphilus]|uniref:aminodeoxychorismate lyase n=1 Tax=Acidithiobacillus ferriphilus TaxID=1689834 RepID=UPI001C05F562|nr:aminodeoxychorismate lyase [Acidithiobacillus ferriphilus]UEP59035.1 aminodeoxychorismate lyase [Acidithiobacillus ferriphilus]
MGVIAATVDGNHFVAGECGVALDRALHYGDGLFETIAVIKGVPLFWDAHLARLGRGAAILNIPMPSPSLWYADLQQILHDVRVHSRLFVKLLLSRGAGWGYGSSGAGPTRRYLYLSQWPERDPHYWEPGISATICPVALLTGAPYLGVKSLNRLNQVMARDALASEYAEGIMLDQSGVLREGIMSNLFWVRAGIVYTPELEDGGIAGIQRGAILEWLRARAVPTMPGRYRAAALQQADEIFFSNSLIGIWPVRRFAERTLPGHDGPIASALLAWCRNMGLGPQS